MLRPIRPLIVLVALGLALSACASGSSSASTAPARQACGRLHAAATRLGDAIEQSSATSASLESSIAGAESKIHALTEALPEGAAKKLKSVPRTLRSLDHAASTGDGAAFAHDDASLQNSVSTALAVCHAQGL